MNMKHLKTVLLLLLLATTISLKPQIKKKQGNVIPHKSAIDFFTSGVKKYDDGRYEAAIIDFNKAIILDSKNTTYFSYRGYAKHNLELSDDDQAIKDFDQAISLNQSSRMYKPL